MLDAYQRQKHIGKPKRDYQQDNSDQKPRSVQEHAAHGLLYDRFEAGQLRLPIPFFAGKKLVGD